MYANVSREEWVFRGLAIVIILALVGIVALSAIGTGDVWIILRNYYWTKSGNAGFAIDFLYWFYTSRWALTALVLTGGSAAAVTGVLIAAGL